MVQVRKWRPHDAAKMLTAPTADSHKYSRGVLGVRTGSSAYPGAAVLGVEAAWRTGLGLVRYTPPVDDRPTSFGLPSPAAAILALRPETVCAKDDPASRDRCDAWLIGSGTDPAHRSFAEREILLQLLAGNAPVIVDAGALDLVTEATLQAPTLLTPHLGEFRAVWRRAGLDDANLERRPGAESVVALARALGATVLLKGSHTIVASPAGQVYQCGPATPWLATAGTGDVLAGVLGALTATHADRVRVETELLAQVAVTGAALHDAAARLAARDGGVGASLEVDDVGVVSAAGEGLELGEREGVGRSTSAAPITALDVANCLPDAYRALRGLLA